jgi:hypothetical protein
MGRNSLDPPFLRSNNLVPLPLNRVKTPDGGRPWFEYLRTAPAHSINGRCERRCQIQLRGILGAGNSARVKRRPAIRSPRKRRLRRASGPHPRRAHTRSPASRSQNQQMPPLIAGSLRKEAARLRCRQRSPIHPAHGEGYSKNLGHQNHVMGNYQPNLQIARRAETNIRRRRTDLVNCCSARSRHENRFAEV